MNEFNEDVDVSILSSLSSWEPLVDSKLSNLPSNVVRSLLISNLSSLPLIPAFQVFSPVSYIKEPDKTPGDSVSLTSIPAFAAPLPLSDKMLSSISTVVESTLVSVPLTNKLPFIVTFEPVNSNPVSTLVSKVSRSINLPLWDPEVVSKEDNLLFCVLFVLSFDEV